MEPLQLWLVMAFSVERLTEFIVKAVPAIEKQEVSAVKVPTLVALILALVVTLGTPLLDFFEMLNVEYEWPYIGQIVSALFIAGGADLVHKIIEKLE